MKTASSLRNADAFGSGISHVSVPIKDHERSRTRRFKLYDFFICRPCSLQPVDSRIVVTGIRQGLHALRSMGVKQH